MKVKINLRDKGKTASIDLEWTKTPFDCTPVFKGEQQVLGAFIHEFESFSGYFINTPSIFNIEAYLNAAYSASRFFEDFTYTLEPAFKLDDYLAPEDKEPDKVY